MKLKSVIKIQLLYKLLMIQQSEELSSEVEVIEIKEDPIDCNHRIAELLFHQSCTKNAQICQQNCKINLSHDFPKNKHEKTAILQFKKSFSNLQQTCNTSAQHYIRQIAQIEQQAFRNIAKKKAECLKEMQNVKKTIMNQTYNDLQNKYPNLYEKFKNSRFDTLSCNEVFWVMKTIKRAPPMKFSEINAKLQKLLKAFENYKDVSKNLNPKQILNKQKAKDIKISQKMKQPQIKVRPNFNIPKPDYSADKVSKTMMQIKFLQDKKNELQRSIKNLREQKTDLADEIAHLIYQKRQRQNRNKIQSNVLQINIRRFYQFNQNKLNIQNSNKNQQNQQAGRVNRQQNVLLSPQIERLKAQEFSTQKKRTNNNNQENQQINRQIHQQQNMLAQIQNIVPQPRQEIVQQNSISNENPQRLNQIAQQLPQMQHNTQQRIIPQQIYKEDSQEEEDQEQEQSENNRPNIEDNRSNIDSRIQQQPQPQQPQPQSQQTLQQRQQNQQKPPQKPLQPQQNQPQPQPSPQSKPQQILPKQPLVKIQHTQNSFQPWRNKELLGQMKKYGKAQSECLKVQNIDILKSFPTVFLRPPKSRINPMLNRPNPRNLPQKPQIFNFTAMQLFQKEIKRKAQLENKPS